MASKKWQYSYAEVLDITNDFKIVIGKGGFGTVYHGQMKDGNQLVAVKMLSPSSSQGPREFQTEVTKNFLCQLFEITFQKMEVIF